MAIMYFFLLCIFLNGSAWNFPNITVWLEKVKRCHFGGRRGRKGKDSEKGLCFLIKVRCRTDFVSLKEHASFSPSVVLSSTGGSVEVPCRRECPPNSLCFVPWPSAFSRAESALWADPRELWIRTCLRKISLQAKRYISTRQKGTAVWP